MTAIETGTPGTASRLRRMLREPLLHFLLIGAALFALFGWKGGSPSAPAGPGGMPSTQVVVTRADLAQMDEQFTKTYQRPPTEEEAARLVEDFVRNEIFYREAVAIGLDRDDAVIRRRLRMKMEFVFEDITALTEPTDEELKAFVETHRAQFVTDPQVAFRQVYINATERGAGAGPEAQRLLAALEAGADPDQVGDRTMLPPEIPPTPLPDIASQFGPEFAKGLLAAPEGKWVGPIRSGYGLHLVRVTEVQQGRLPEWSDLREAARQQWMATRQQEMKDAAYAKLRERYTVTVEAPEGGAAPAPGAGR